VERAHARRVQLEARSGDVMTLIRALTIVVVILIAIGVNLSIVGAA
jgi:hypothetical protein